MLQFADDLGVTIMVERVENAAEEKALIDLGILYHQGFFRGAPMPLLESQVHFPIAEEGF
jgi:EAL domain-containing protein (putative c-di-GMP-specific phosphodiesterase class I)